MLAVSALLAMLIFALLTMFMVAPASAAAPGPQPGVPISGNSHATPRHYASQSAAWLARKHQFQILRPGIHRPACVGSCNPPPDSYTLDESVVSTTLEPSGNPRMSWPSTPQVSATQETDYGYNVDDADVLYSNKNMYGLCGPGALTNALSYWGAPVTSNGKHLFTDISVKNNPTPAAAWSANEQTTWNDVSYGDISPRYNNEHITPTAHRSYMMYIAWLSNPNGEWRPDSGVMDDFNYPSLGVWLQGAQDVLNWEASGHNVNTWSDFFYTVQWDANNNPGGGTQVQLLSDVETDLWYDHVPVVAEVNANMLPNWPSSGSTYHLITIIGYDNTTNQYTYVDSCGSANERGTGCGALSQQIPHFVDQTTMYNAINDIPYSLKTEDGGWIW
jgi:hypothetical protein